VSPRQPTPALRSVTARSMPSRPGAARRCGRT
jgi:hypothetical protein